MGVVVVVVAEAALCDLEVEEPPDAGGTTDARRGAAYFGGVFEPTFADPLFQGEQVGVGAADEFSSAGVVSAGAGLGCHDHGEDAVGEGDVCGPAAVLGDLDAGGVFVDGVEDFFSDVVAVQPGGQHMVEPGIGDRVDGSGSTGPATEPPSPRT